MLTVFSCAYCGEPNDLFVDPTGGDRQSYIEDCQVCCRPNLLVILGSATEDAYTVDSSPENE